MKEMFADILKNTRNLEEGRHPLNRTFEVSLFNSSWYFPFKKIDPKKSQEEVARVEVEQVKEVEAQVKAEIPKVKIESPDPIIEERPVSIGQEFKCSEMTSFQEYLHSLKNEWSEEHVVGAANFKGQCDILFYGELQLEDISEVEFPPHNFLALDTDLLGKMIIAMKLENGRFVRSSILGPKKVAIENFAKEVSLFRPKIVITLGASALNLVLGRKERLSSIHGEFFASKVETDKGSIDFQIVPLFHPEFLEINPSMKRTAWIDMQKVMTYLKDQSSLA